MNFKKILIVLFFVLLTGCEKDAEKNNQKPTYKSLEIVETLETKESARNTNFTKNNVLDIEEKINENLVVSEALALDFYSIINKDLYFKIQLDNPSNYEIQSVKINDTVYNNFEEESNKNNIIIKFNSGEQPGIFDYKVNEITYKVNEIIEKIIDEGNVPVRLGLFHVSVPKIDISNSDVLYNKLKFNYNIEDPNNIASYYKLYILEENDLKEYSQLTINSSIGEVKNLKANTYYQYAIVTEYDLLDGLGNRIVILHKGEFKTSPIIELVNLNIGDSYIDFDLKINDFDKTGKISSLNIYWNNQLVQSLQDLEERSFTNLEPGKEYQVSFVYEYLIDDKKHYSEINEIVATVSKDIINIKSIKIQNNSTVNIGDKVNALIEFNNPLNQLVYSVFIDGEEVLLKEPSKLTGEIEFIPSSNGGIYQIEVEGLNYKIYDTTIYQKINSPIKDEINIIGNSTNNKLNLLSIYNEGNENIFIKGKENYLIFEFENLSDYQIEEIVLSNKTYPKDEIEIIDNKVKVFYNIKFNTGLKENINIKEIKYKSLEESKSLNIDKDYEFWVLLSSDVRTISTIDELSKMEIGYSYKLVNDIDCTGYNWKPITLNGILDGNGYELKNISLKNRSIFDSLSGMIKNLNFSVVSLYENIYSNNIGVLCNEISRYVKIMNCNINLDINYYAYFKFDFYFGGLIALNRGSLEVIDTNLLTNINIKSNNIMHVGGVLAKNEGFAFFNNVKTSGEINIDISNNIYYGGIIGEGLAKINNCQVDSNVSITNNEDLVLGGIIGVGNQSVVEGCTVNGNISVETNTNAVITAAGIGLNLMKVDNCLVRSNISLITQTIINFGGITSSSKDTTVSNSSVLGNIYLKSRESCVGGILCESNGKINNCTMAGDIYVEDKSSTDYFTLIAGISSARDFNTYYDENHNPIYNINEIDSCKVYGNITANSSNRVFSGGVVSIGMAKITNSDVYGNISISCDMYAFVGGIVGEGLITPNIEDCSYNGNIAVNSEYISYVGGVMGYFKHSHIYDMVVNKVSVIGDIKVTTNLRVYAGGLFGYIDRETLVNLLIKESRYNGNINVRTPDNSFAGGFIGHSGTLLNIENCEVGGTIKADSKASAYVGGFVASGTLSIRNSLMRATLNTLSNNISYLGGFLAFNKYINPLSFENSLMLGNIEATMYGLAGKYMKAYLGYNSVNATLTNNLCYVGENSTIKLNNIIQSLGKVNLASKDILNLINFYKENLQFDETLWDLSNLNYENNKFIKLISN